MERKGSALSATHYPEPELLFGGGFPCPDPKTGLALYGPYSEHPKQITLGIVGDSETVDQAWKLLELCRNSISGDPAYPSWKSGFPGMNLGSPFGCELVTTPDWCEVLTNDEMARFERIPRRQERIRFAVDLMCEHIQKQKAKEGSPRLFVCAPPRRMMDLCIPIEGEEKGGPRGRKSESEKRVETSAEDPRQRRLWEFSPEVEEIRDEMLQKMVSDNFHNLLKARAMRMGAPTQFIRPYTLDKLFGKVEGRLQDPATICWNLAVALHYKAGGRPWRLQDIPAGTCFVGIAFYHEKVGGHVGTSLAQVFTPEGEGLVLRGERFKWEPKREPHLSLDAARRLMGQVLRAYEEHTQHGPSRVVVHKSSKFTDAEISGMNAGLAGVARKDFVSIYERARGIKLFRAGYHPPIRGTVVTLPDDSRLLFTRGFVPYMRIYPGARVPRPLEVRFEQADTPRDELCREILALTRSNWNTADFACLLPITLQFARQVGNILREVPAGIPPESRYLYYM